MTPRNQLLAEIARQPSPTRTEGRTRSRWAALLSMAVAVSIFEMAGGFENSAGRPMVLTLGHAAGWGLFATALSTFVLWRRTTLGRPPRGLLAAALAAPLALLGWMQLFDGAYVEPFSRVGWKCMAYTFAMAALPLASFMLLRRGLEPRGAWQLGAAIGAVTGAWAGVLVELWCPLVNLPHALVGHVLPLVVLIIAGALFGRRALDLAARPLPAK